MKKILLFICTFFCLIANAQLDTEHWFAPMSASSLQGTPECYLYLSTNETTPFSVQIYNNNAVFSTVQISKGNPVQVTIPNNFMIASTVSNIFTQRTMGLNVKGSKKFFANFRFAVPNQAEIITSKGLAGVGKNFFVGVAPNTTAKPYVNSTIGFVATEDNTTVTLSGYNAGVVFSDGVSAPSRTFTINKGKSYIIEARSDLSTNNLAGLVGAKITSNKPISVTNGNFNSIYTTQNNSNVDVLMDQAVPVDRLGKDFVMVKGNGPANSGMEAALVIATENNTQLTVNGNLLGNVTLNEGQYYIVQGSNYINQGNSGHYNMSLSANKNVYVYQLLAGTSGSTVYATGGMNFIPPLSCFLPTEINEIGFINKIGSDTFNTKLNIITQTGATVTFNNNNIAAGNGPFPVNGNPGWVSYSIPNVTGNITVNSTLPVTAGIAAGNGAVGYGGYFAGFSSVPAITKTGDCYAGILLQVDSNYDTYQWFLNGTLISGATSFSINPELYGEGDYTCSVTKNNCETRLTTPYTYTFCPPISTTTFNIGSCNTKVITPAFTNSTQNIVPYLTSIIAPPTSGTATVNPTTGQITYTPNPTTVNTTDSFTYYIQGNGNPFDFEYFKININTNVVQVNNGTLTTCFGTVYNLTSVNLSPDSGVTITYFSDPNLTAQIMLPTYWPAPSGTVYATVTSQYGCSKTAEITLTTIPAPTVSNTTLTSCAGANGNGNFNLTTANVSSDPGVTITYFTNSNLTGQITNPANYSGTAGIIYANVSSAGGCSKTAQITLVTTLAPSININNYNATLCDDNFDGIVNVDFSTVSSQIVANTANQNIRYYLNQADANTGNSNILPNNWMYSANTTVYVRVDAISGNCPAVFGQINFQIGNKITLLTNTLNSEICDNDMNGSENVNLNDYKNLFTNDPAVTATFHSTLSDAQNGMNVLSLNQAITTPNVYYVRFVSAIECPNTGIITLGLKTPLKSEKLINKVICSSEKVLLDPGSEFTSYTWNTGATTQTILAGAGSYYVDLGFNGCTYRQYVNVTNSQAPIITSITVNGSSATIHVTGGTAPYQYSLNGVDYQTSNIFSGLQKGLHKVYVLSREGCLPVTAEFLVLNLVNTITPNGDGVNDVLNYSELRLKKDVSIQVSDRYGTIVYKSPANTFIWDGKPAGRALSTGTYWYILKWAEPDTQLPVSYTGWLLIKNRD
ncbi:gliding motility-associated C-terminal domain-containing protein [Chryseobacterium sp.]|uniref:T9SS type B sorting domain-containing protein n=1 Tax=Chryseobacterium sp. TaxID=1871047 RepID=UPI0028986670|nr:gliding motility-associated C-terminal domain-containing protein [Chryseobacterium sp.]